MTTGAPGTPCRAAGQRPGPLAGQCAPDVSSVLAAARDYANGSRRHDPEQRTKVQQAAEQACYRYALATLERCCDADGRTLAYERFRDERARLNQLLARSA